MNLAVVNGVPPGLPGGAVIRKEEQKEIHIWLEVGVGSCWSSGNGGGRAERLPGAVVRRVAADAG
jgi:hypothetical protein